MFPVILLELRITLCLRVLSTFTNFNLQYIDKKHSPKLNEIFLFHMVLWGKLGPYNKGFFTYFNLVTLIFRYRQNNR